MMKSPAVATSVTTRLMVEKTGLRCSTTTIAETIAADCQEDEDGQQHRQIFPATASAATTTKLSSARGRSTFHPRCMS